MTDKLKITQTQFIKKKKKKLCQLQLYYAFVQRER